MRGALLALQCAAAVAALLGSCRAILWTRSSSCSDTTEHLYQYVANEEYFGEDLTQSSKMTINFGITCREEGRSRNINAKNLDEAIMYSLVVTHVHVNGSIVNLMEEDGDDVQLTTRDLEDHLEEGYFYFVLTTQGHVTHIYYDSDEYDEVVNIKKRLAATFQVNYNGTEERYEADPQSAHLSKYSYADKSGRGNNTRSTNATRRNLREGKQEITRTISDANVEAFTSSIPNEEINYGRRDVVNLENAVVMTATGETNIVLIPDQIKATQTVENQTLEDGIRAKLHRKRSVRNDDPYNPFAITNFYEAKSTYNMEHVGQRRMVRTKRFADEIDLEAAVESTLFATVNLTRRALKYMSELRQEIGDIHEALEDQHRNTQDTAIAQKIETLVKKEAEFGPAPGYDPAVVDVMEYLQSLLGSSEVSDVNMRQLLYFILSPEGTLSPQMALLQSFEDAVNEDEKESVLFYIAFVANPQPQMVARLEELIPSDVNTNDPLLLAYGAIIPRAAPPLKARMISFLLDRLPFAETESKSLVHHILALGNAGSPETSETIIDYLGHPDQGVQLTSILALRSLLNETLVKKALRELLLNPDTSVNHIAMIAKALLYGAEEASLKRVPRPYPQELVQPLVIMAANSDDEYTQATVSRYLETVNTESSNKLKELFNALKSTNYYDGLNLTRVRRGDVWDEANSVYDLVEPLDERKEDVSTYTHHLSYIWGRLLGGKDINMQIAAGGFAGVSNGGAYKVYGHAVAQATVYNRRTTFVDFILLRRKDNSSTETKIYGNVMGKTLKDIDLTEEAEVCKTFTESLYDGKVYTVFDFTYSVFVEVGNLDFGVKATVQFTVGLEVAFCDKPGRVTAAAQLTPTVTLTVEASGDLEILFVAKAGLTADAVLNYQLQPGVNSEICYTEGQVRNKNCVGIYDQWKDSRIDLYAWYAWRGWCGWWACTGSKAYQNKHKIDALSFEWDLPASAQNTLAEKCDKTYTCVEE